MQNIYASATSPLSLEYLCF